MKHYSHETSNDAQVKLGNNLFYILDINDSNEFYNKETYLNLKMYHKIRDIYNPRPLLWRKGERHNRTYNMLIYIKY